MVRSVLSDIREDRMDCEEKGVLDVDPSPRFEDTDALGRDGGVMIWASCPRCRKRVEKERDHKEQGWLDETDSVGIACHRMLRPPPLFASYDRKEMSEIRMEMRRRRRREGGEKKGLLR
jgi:hypothetical protein